MAIPTIEIQGQTVTKLRKDVERMIEAKGDIASQTKSNYRCAERQFSAWLGKPAKRKHLTEEKVNGWLVSLEESGLSPTTVHNKHRAIKVLWNHLVEIGEMDKYVPAKMRKTRNDFRPAEAWTTEQLRQLLRAASDLGGRRVGDVDAGLVMTGYLLVGAETGLRPSDMRRLTPCHINLETGAINITMHKTGKPITRQISPSTLAVVRQLVDAGGETVFNLSKTTLYHWSRQLFLAASKHGFERKRGQGLGTLRKLHATELTRENGVEAACEALGHSNSTITRRHYIQNDALPAPKSLTFEIELADDLHRPSRPADSCLNVSKPH